MGWRAYQLPRRTRREKAKRETDRGRIGVLHLRRVTFGCKSCSRHICIMYAYSVSTTYIQDVTEEAGG